MKMPGRNENNLIEKLKCMKKKKIFKARIKIKRK